MVSVFSRTHCSAKSCKWIRGAVSHLQLCRCRLLKYFFYDMKFFQATGTSLHWRVGNKSGKSNYIQIFCSATYEMTAHCEADYACTSCDICSFRPLCTHVDQSVVIIPSCLTSDAVLEAKCYGLCLEGPDLGLESCIDNFFGIRLIGWYLMALWAQKGYIVPCKK